MNDKHTNKRTETHACDLISRQDAIDIERRATVDTNPEHFESHQKFVEFMDDAEISSFGRWQWSNGFNTALTAVGIDLKRLPSAQPNVPDTNVGDTISRQAAIDALEKLSANYTGVGKREWHPHVRECQYEIQHMPPAQPERPKGHWIFDFAHNEMTCSECGLTFTGGFDLDNADNFCRHCGSDMRGEQNGNT